MGWRAKLSAKRRNIAALTCVLFVAGAAAFSAVRPRIYEASAKVAIRQASETSGRRTGGSLASTEAEVVRSDGVLDLAANKLGLSRSPKNDELKQSLSPEVIEGTDVLQIRARRALAQQSADWANAVAESYVEYRRTSMVDNAAATGGVITRAIQADSAKIAELQSQIRANPSAADALRAEERRLAARVRNLQTQLLGLTDSEALRQGGATIIDLADFPSSPSVPNWPRDLGLAGGVGLGVGTLISLKAKPPRLPRRRRRESRDQSIRANELQQAAFSLSGSDDLDKLGEWLHLLGRALVKLDGQLGALSSRMDEQQANVTSKVDKVVGKLDEVSTAAEARLKEMGERMVSGMSAEMPAMSRAIEESKRATLEEIREDRLQMAERMAELNYEMLQRFATVGVKVTQELGQLREEVMGKMVMQEDAAARHEDLLTRVDWMAARLDREAAAASERLEDIFRRVHSHLAAQEPAVSAALQVVKRETLDEVREERLQMADQMAGLKHELMQRLVAVGLGVTEGIGQLREEVLGKVVMQQDFAAQHADIVGRVDWLAAKLDREAASATERLEDIFEQVQSRLAVQEPTVTVALQTAQQETIDEIRRDRLEMAERMAELNQEMMQRLGKVVVKVGHELEQLRKEIKIGRQGGSGKAQDLVDLRGEILEGMERRIADTLERMGGMQESIESRLDVESSVFSSQISGVLSHLADHSREIETRMSQAVSRLDLSLAQKADITRSELVQRVGTLDAEAAQRLSEVAAGLSEALTGLRNEVSQKLNATEMALVEMLETVESRRKSESSEITRRMSAVSDQIETHMEALEIRLAASGEEMKNKLQEGSRGKLDRLTEGLSQIDQEAADRLGKLAASIKRALSELKGRMSEELSAQHGDLSARLDSLESRVAETSRLAASGEEMKKQLQEGSRGELDRLANGLSQIDQEAADRLGKLAASIKRALSELNGRVSEELSAQHGDLSARLDSLEARLAEITRLAASGEEMKKQVQEASRGELSRLAEGLSQIDQKAADRLGKLAASIQGALTDLRGRVSQELSAQHGDLSARLQSLEAKVAETTAGANKGVSGRLKNMEESVSELASHLDERSERTGRGRIVPIAATRSRPERGKEAATQAPRSGRKRDRNGADTENGRAPRGKR